MYTNNDVVKELKKIADSEIAEHSKRYFKAGPGEYGEGDQFLGIRVPDQRKIAKKYRELDLQSVQKLLTSEFHEVRLTTLFILVNKYKKASEKHREEIFGFYLDHLGYVNNWDLVDSSAKYIAGHYLFDKDRQVLFDLATSENLWERRVAILSTFHFIDQGDFSTTLEISELLLNDEEDLIHKAVGWMLREVGNNDKATLTVFLHKFYKTMPRTMLRYAIEKLPEKERKLYLKGEI
ncbi:MAG: DNA alkylation repair protein [Balneolaceae bacterium]|nr:MAG: DNA alkylation repair protein [Balneolaceae bacterium]